MLIPTFALADPLQGRLLARRLRNAVDRARVARSPVARQRLRRSAWRNGCQILALLVGTRDDELSAALTDWFNAESNDYDDWIT
ncbi:MAG: hypothetical protein ACYTEZ_20385 [Planctomycetota bacterium]|jgi:hypothetical protein